MGDDSTNDTKLNKPVLNYDALLEDSKFPAL